MEQMDRATLPRRARCGSQQTLVGSFRRRYPGFWQRMTIMPRQSRRDKPHYFAYSSAIVGSVQIHWEDKRSAPNIPKVNVRIYH